MKYKVFVDTNVLLSGIFFEGNESSILDKDIPILAAVLYVKPDYFLTGDAHFFTDNIRSVVNVITASDFLAKIK